MIVLSFLTKALKLLSIAEKVKTNCKLWLPSITILHQSESDNRKGSFKKAQMSYKCTQQQATH